MLYVDDLCENFKLHTAFNTPQHRQPFETEESKQNNRNSLYQYQHQL